MSPSEGLEALAASDKTSLGSGFRRYRLRVRVRDSCVFVDPEQADITISDASERLFRGSLRPNADGEGSVLDGCFYLSWMARFVFFPFWYFALGYLFPRLRIVDARRGEAMLREWLATLLASG